MSPRKPKGLVSLVGAGPGDPGLITVRGLERLEQADVVVVDRLASPELLAHCRDGVEVVHAGKVPHGEGMSQDDINRVIVDRGRQGLRVVRLKGGDPFVFGRGGEEAEACAKARIPWEVVPGISSAIAVPAYAGIPVTQRGFTQDVTIVSGHVDPSSRHSSVDWPALAAGPGTIVLLMGVEKIGAIASALIEHGRPAATPVAMTRWGTTARQRTVVSTLDRIEADARAQGMSAPAVTVIGDVVTLRDRLSWFETQPLFGVRVIVPRTRQQAGSLSGELRRLGAEPIEIPTIAIEPPRNAAPMDRAVTGLVSGRHAWVVFTSTNAVRAVTSRLDDLGLDARVLGGVKVAAVGDATRDALRAWGLRPDLVPTGEMSGEALAQQFPTYDPDVDFLDRVLLPRADIATETLVDGLKAKGWTVEEVTAYRTTRAPAPPAELRDAIASGDVEAVVFTSSSTARNLVAMVGELPDTMLVAAIGPQTAKTCAELGLRVDAVAAKPGVEGLAAALAEAVSTRRQKAVDRVTTRSRATTPSRRTRPATTAPTRARSAR